MEQNPENHDLGLKDANVQSLKKMLTVLKSHINATNATMHLPIQAI